MCFVFPLGLLLEHNAFNTYFVFHVTNYTVRMCDALYDVVVNTVVGQHYRPTATEGRPLLSNQ